MPPPLETPPPDALAPPTPVEPPLTEGPTATDPAPPGPPPSTGDAVTDLLLTPLPQRDQAVSAPSKPPAPPQGDPFMGFRPMRGQTPRSY